MTSRKLSTLLATVVGAALLAGCGADADAAGSSTPAPDRSPTAPATTPSEAPVDPDALVRPVEVRRADLPEGYGADQFQRGDEVEGQVSLDLCAATFPSEQLRTARHQVRYALEGLDPSGSDDLSDSAWVSTETVAYRPGGAEQAMQELRDAVASCPSGYVPSVIANVPDLRTTITPMRPAAGWQADHLAVVNTIEFRTGESLRLALVYQRRGDVLAMVYVPAGVRGRGEGLARRTATLLSERLATALP